MKKRMPYLIATVALVVISILLYTFQAQLPIFMANYLPEVIWACGIYAFVAFLFAKNPFLHGGVAVAIAVVIEASQLYQAAWITAVRGTFLGRYMLGSSFLWSDIICYVVGIAICVAVEFIIVSRKPKVRESKYRK